MVQIFSFGIEHKDKRWETEQGDVKWDVKNRDGYEMTYPTSQMEVYRELLVWHVTSLFMETWFCGHYQDIEIAATC